MNQEYNKLTTSLLAQGFTTDNHPDYVKLPGCIPDKADPLKNYKGGFVYQRSYADRLIYKTGCGKFIKGRNVLHDMGYMGIDWCHENDNPVLRCPYDNSECSRNNPLLHGSNGGVLRAQCWCECHKTAETYDYQNSIELANAEREAERKQKYEEYARLHHGRVCENHMYYDERTRTWEQRYEPQKCFRRCYSHFCPIRNRELSSKRGNVYYDLKTTRIRQDGTLFDGEKIVSVTRGIRYYEHPVSMDICEDFVKLQSGRIYEEYKRNHSWLWFSDNTFQAEILNIRAESSRPSRDLIQDLQDIKSGIEIRYDADLRKAAKEQKSRKPWKRRSRRWNGSCWMLAMRTWCHTPWIKSMPTNGLHRSGYRSWQRYGNNEYWRNKTGRYSSACHRMYFFHKIFSSISALRSLYLLKAFSTDRNNKLCYNMRKRGILFMANRTKTIQELNLEDDFLFGKVMSDNEICRKVLEKILNVSIKKVEFLVTQKTIDMLLDGKGIRLDVYVNDEQGTVYSVEMQRGRKRELPKRTRFYQGNIDSDLLSSGESYTKLNKTYIIFICTFDPFSDRRHIYTFENRCLENLSLALGDETTKIFLSTKGEMDDVDAEMKELLAYIENSTDAFAAQAASPLVKEIHKRVTEVKQNKDMEVEYMTLLQRDRENIELGTAQATKIIKLYHKGISNEEIASSLQLDLEYVGSVISDYEND